MVLSPIRKILSSIERHQVRDYANAQNIEAEEALAVGMSEKAKEFVATGGEIYHGMIPEGVKHDH